MRTILSALLLIVTILWWPDHSDAQKLDVPYVPTPPSVVDRMLDLANLGPGDYLIDLGSGDGRIVIEAGLRGAAGHGVDLDRNLVEASREKAAVAEVSDRVMFLREDIYETEIRQASVITLYLLTRINLKLRPRLLEELRPGTRVISHSFHMGEWTPDSTLSVTTPSNAEHKIYLWIIPARAEGRWRWKTDRVQHNLSIRQKFQKITPDLRTGKGFFTVSDAVLQGRRISFRAEERPGGNYRYSGRIQGNRIWGFVQIRQNGEQRVEKWTARRK